MDSNMVALALKDTFQFGYQLDNFDSFIWNERYRKLGDFQLRTYAVKETLSAVTLGSFIQSSNSDIPMIVTNINVGTDSQNVSVLTVRGVTLDYIFNYRPAYPYLGSSVYMDAMGPIEFGDKLGDVPGVKPSAVLKAVIDSLDNGYGRLTQPFGSKYKLYLTLEIDQSVVNSESVPEGRLIYYEITKDKTVMDVLNELSSVNGFSWYIYVKDSKPVLKIYQPAIKEERYISFDKHNDDYLSEHSSVSFDIPNVNIISRYDDVITSNSLSALPYGVNQAFNFRIKTGTINDKEMSVYEWNKAKEEELVVNPVSDYVSMNSISLETFGTYPYQVKKFSRYNGSDSFNLGDIVVVNTSSSGVLFQKDNRMQVTEFVRAVDSRGYMEYPVFQPFVKLGVNDHNMAKVYRDSIKTFDWN